MDDSVITSTGVGIYGFNPKENGISSVFVDHRVDCDIDVQKYINDCLCEGSCNESILRNSSEVVSSPWLNHSRGISVMGVSNNLYSSFEVTLTEIYMNADKVKSIMAEGGRYSDVVLILLAQSNLILNRDRYQTEYTNPPGLNQLAWYCYTHTNGITKKKIYGIPQFSEILELKGTELKKDKGIFLYQKENDVIISGL